MASSSRSAQQLSVEAPHFMTTITPQLLSLGKLEIPTAFVMGHGTDLHDSVFLKVSTGETLTAALEKRGARIFLGDGWSKFLRHFSIMADYKVTLSFKGHSMFHVVIYDPSGFEVESPAGCAYCANQLPREPVISLSESETSSEDSEVGSDLDFFSAAQPTRPNVRGRRGPILNQALAAARQFASDNPFFMVQMRDCLKRTGPSVSFAAMKACNLNEGVNDVTFEYGEEVWGLKITFFPSALQAPGFNAAGLNLGTLCP